MTRWSAIAIAGALALMPAVLHAQQSAPASKVDPTMGAVPEKTDLQAPVEAGKAATAGSGSKVEITSGATGSSEQKPVTGAADAGSRDVTPGSGNEPSDKMAKPIPHASPGPEGQGPTAGPVNPPKQ